MAIEQPRYPLLFAYVVAVTSVMMVFALRASLDPILKDVAPVILFLIPVAFSAWYGGLGPGMVATVLGGLLGIGYFATARSTSGQDHSPIFHWLARGIPFFIVGTTLSLLAAQAKRAVRRAQGSELSLRRTEALQRQIFESATEFSIFSTDLSGNITTWSAGAEKLFGYSETEALGMHASRIYTPEDVAANVPERELNVARERGRANDERWHLRKDATRFFANGVVTPLRDDAGTHIGYTKIARDYTLQHETQLALVDARRRSDSAMLAGEMGTFEWDIKSDRVHGDENFARIFELDRDAAGSAPLRDYVKIIHPEDRARVNELVQHSIHTGEDYATEYRVVGRDAVRWVLARGRMVKDAAGHVVRFPGVVVDVTERKAAQSKLDLRETRYKTLFDSIDDGFCIIEMIFDKSGKAIDYLFLEANNAFKTQSGMTHPGGRRMREFAPDHEEHWFETYGRVAVTGEPVRFINEAKSLNRWFGLYACRVGGPGSNQVAVLFTDITQMRLAEQERERLLASETAARQSAEDASRTKDEFLATVSHELRTPLAAIAGWASLLPRVKNNPKMVEEGITVIARNASAQAQLIEDILDISRITNGKLRLNTSQFDLRGPIAAAISTVSNAARARDIAIETDHFEGPAPVTGDADRLQQVFWNLLSNAIKFSQRGGRVRVSLASHASRLTISVQDDGQGIHADFIPHLFERFRQADMSTTRRQGGLGLGLSIVRHLIELHGGTVQAQSEGEGLGSRFVVDLPYAAVLQSAPGIATGTPRRDFGITECPPQLSTKRILVLDDEPDARRILEAILSNCGLHVTTAATVGDALVILQSNPFDAVLSDIGMPGEDGYSFIRRLRELEAQSDRPRLPAAALTAYTRDTDAEAARLAGFDAHLPKPVDPQLLLRTLDEIMSAN